MVSIEARSLDRDSPVPLWFQIAELLRESIESAQIAPGEQLDNEVDIAERLGVSRPTVRQAIHALVQKDLVVRRRGVGTMVASRQIKRPVAFTSLYEDLTAAGRSPSTTVLRLQETKADPEVAAELGIQPGAPVHHVERVRFAEGSPLALMSNLVPIEVLSAPLELGELQESGLYELMRARGVRFHMAHEVIGARRVTAREARLLGTTRSETVLSMTRTAADTTGRIVEIGRHSYLASKYSFEINLSLR